MNRWMRRRNRKPFSLFVVFMNSRVHLAWGGRFTMDDSFFDGAT